MSLGAFNDGYPPVQPATPNNSSPAMRRPLTVVGRANSAVNSKMIGSYETPVPSRADQTSNHGVAAVTGGLVQCSRSV